MGVVEISQCQPSPTQYQALTPYFGEHPPQFFITGELAAFSGTPALFHSTQKVQPLNGVFQRSVFRHSLGQTMQGFFDVCDHDFIVAETLCHLAWST